VSKKKKFLFRKKALEVWRDHRITGGGGRGVTGRRKERREVKLHWEEIIKGTNLLMGKDEDGKKPREGEEKRRGHHHAGRGLTPYLANPSLRDGGGQLPNDKAVIKGERKTAAEKREGIKKGGEEQ